MKKIINVVEIKDENDVRKINEQLEDTRLRFEIDVERSAVIVFGGSDEVRVAVHAIRNAGYDVL